MTQWDDQTTIDIAKRRNPEAESTIILFLLIVSVFFWLLFRFGPAALNWVGEFFKQNELFLSFCYTILIVLAAFGMYEFRKAKQRYYGLTECSFAIVTCWFSVYPLDGHLPKAWLPLLAAGFFFVRGLVNFHEGKDKAK